MRQQREGVTRGHLKDTDGLSLVHAILQKASRFVWVQMMEGGKKRPESLKVSGDLRCVDRVPEEVNAIRGRKLPIMKLSRTRIFVRQENFGRLGAVHFEMAHEGWPGSASPRA